MINIKELLLYTINKKYIKYLSEFERHISYNKDETGHSRPYLGIVLEIKNYEYFVPLYSYKEHYDRYKSNSSFFFIYNKRKKPLSIIKFSAMIPVPKNIKVTIACDFKLLEDKSLKYKVEEKVPN